MIGFLSAAVLGGSVAMLIAVSIGLNRSLKSAGWQDRDRNRATITIAALLIAWFVAALVTARLGFYQGAATHAPTIQYGLLIPILVGIALFRSWRLLRSVVDALPQKWIAGVQFFRVEGAIFLVLLAAGRLPGVFAWPAGVGDILVGLIAPIIGAGYMRQPDDMAGRLRAWNLLGLLDLVVAVTTGFLSSPSRLQLFAFDQPNVLISAFPLVLIPVFFVPFAVLLHLASLAKLRQREPGEGNVSLRGGQTSIEPNQLA